MRWASAIVSYTMGQGIYMQSHMMQLCGDIGKVAATDAPATASSAIDDIDAEHLLH